MSDPDPTTGRVSPAEVCEQFCRYLDRIHGVYLDATMAMGGMAAWYMKMDRDRWPQLEKSTEAVAWDVLNPEIVYGGMVRGKDGDLHRARLHDVIRRNSPDGSNWQFLALMCVVGLYQYALLPNSARQFRMRYYQSFGAGSNHGEAPEGFRWAAAI